MHKLAVIAIGGNALIEDAEHMTVLDQYRRAGETAGHIAEVLAKGWRVVITHGNGPQVGFILLRSELSRGTLHQVPLESCVADTQGAIGYQIQQSLENELRRRDMWQSAATVITQVVVDKNDPAFASPSKPIGPFYSEEDAQRYIREDGWIMREDSGRGWRRVVPSPAPREIIEEPVIRELVNSDIVVIAVGGGGIPVVEGEGGLLSGCPAVIDKDTASALLAARLQAELFLIATAVDRVALNFGTPEETPLDRITLAEAKRYLGEGQFAEGSMKPKIEAAVSFLEQGGERVIITQPDLMQDALDGKAGTHMVGN